jgi:hypothetical protein
MLFGVGGTWTVFYQTIRLKVKKAMVPALLATFVKDELNVETQAYMGG